MSYATNRVCLLVLLGLIVAMLTSSGAPGIVNGQSAEQQEDETDKILREGTKVDSQVASCRSSGERLEIEMDGQRKLIALENLAAQRILEAIQNEPNDKYWSVSGTITEFQGRNFLLLQHVTRGTKATGR